MVHSTFTNSNPHQLQVPVIVPNSFNVISIQRRCHGITREVPENKNILHETVTEYDVQINYADRGGLNSLGDPHVIIKYLFYSFKINYAKPKQQSHRANLAWRLRVPDPGTVEKIFRGTFSLSTPKSIWATRSSTTLKTVNTVIKKARSKVITKGGTTSSGLTGAPNDWFLQNICSEKKILPRIFH